MKFASVRSTCYILLALLMACTGQNGRKNASVVTLTIDGGSRAAAPAPAQAAPLVASALFTISAPDMTTISRSVSISAGAVLSESFTVPNGNGRMFLVEVQDASGETAYAGSDTTDLAGTPVTLTIDLKPQFFTGTRLIGTPQNEAAAAVARDAGGNTIVAGHTYGGLDSGVNADATGSTPDAFLRKSDRSGAVLWTRQFGTTSYDIAGGVAADPAGNIIAVGTTGGSLNGETNAGFADCFIVKFDAAGNILWTRLLGDTGDDMGNAVATDAAGNIYVAGFLSAATSGYDAFLAKYGPSGTQQWLVRFGTPSYDAATGIGVGPDGSLYLAGYTYGDLDGNSNAGPGGTTPDAFIAKVDPAGTGRTTVQFGSPDIDQATAIASDATSGLLYVAGLTYGDLHGQANMDLSGATSDAFLAAFDTSLTRRSTRMIGTIGNDTAGGVAVDSAGNVLVAGSTNGAFPGFTNAGGYDVFTARFGPAGPPVWTQQLGTASADDAAAIAVDLRNGVLVSGTTGGSFDAVANNGGSDAFLMSYDRNGIKW